MDKCFSCHLRLESVEYLLALITTSCPNRKSSQQHHVSEGNKKHTKCSHVLEESTLKKPSDYFER